MSRAEQSVESNQRYTRLKAPMRADISVVEAEEMREMRDMYSVVVRMKTEGLGGRKRNHVCAPCMYCAVCM